MKRTRHFVRTGLLSLYALVFLGGCSHMLLLHPKGPVGTVARSVIIEAFVLMLIVVVPVIVMAIWFPLKYRASNTKATYAPKWCRSGKIEAIIWVVPAIIVTILGVLVWNGTHQLDPYKPLSASVKPLRIEAVALDWKWLFIYPQQHIATVNELVFPAGVPLNFRITSATVMTSFFIPQLGSQIYAMAGMQTRLHLLADDIGTFAGQNQQFSGNGFCDMTFKAHSTTQRGFQQWVQKVKQSPQQLDVTRFEAIAKPSIAAPVALFSAVQPNLFQYVLNQYRPRPQGANPAVLVHQSGSAHLQTRASEEQ